MHGSLPNTEPLSTVKHVSGKSVAYKLRGHPDWRVWLAIKLINGHVELSRFTIGQALKITGASRSQLNDLRRDLAGCSLRDLQRSQRADRLVARIGPDAVMAALDRATRPTAG